MLRKAGSCQEVIAARGQLGNINSGKVILPSLLLPKSLLSKFLLLQSLLLKPDSANTAPAWRKRSGLREAESEGARAYCLPVNVGKETMFLVLSRLRVSTLEFSVTDPGCAAS